MAEVFAAVASGAGLVSLALQLAESAMKVKKLCETMRHAPEILEDLSSELELFSMLLTEIAGDEPERSGVSADLVVRCVQACENKVAKIRWSIEKLENMMRRSPIIARFRTALEEKELGALCNSLERAKTS